MDNKLIYQAPEAKIQDVAFESSILSGEKFTISGYGSDTDNEI